MDGKTFILRAVLAAMLAATATMTASASAPDPGAVKRKIGQAEYYVKEFEKEVERQKGGEKAVWRSKNDAVSRVKALKQEFPDDPDVQKLFLRVRTALMKSKGDYTEVNEEWTAYKRNEESLRQTIASFAEDEWKSLSAKFADNILEKAFPAPDSAEVTLDDLGEKYVILDDIRYPMNQFYGETGEYVFSGKPSEGFYYVDISSRDWLGPYEAVKRYRRNVDSGLQDVEKWTVLGKITTVVLENTHPGENSVGASTYGWVVKPEALYVPGHVLAIRDNEAPGSGRYIGEEKVAAIKDSWYTVKSVPADVTPEKLMEIFMTAIREKNYALYQECIDPERQKTPVAEDLLRYHWDLHQERFHREYVHATFDKAEITVVSGFDEDADDENFFLTEDQKDTLAKISGEKVEDAKVESKAIDERGKQVGSPNPHHLIRRGGGRWYVEDYEIRF